MPIDLNLPALSESDPGKPIKASWGDRVVTAIGLNCESIIGLGKANSVFPQAFGDGSDGNLDVAVNTNLAVPFGGFQFENLTIRAGVTLQLIRTVTFATPVDCFGVFRIGVSGTFTMEAGAILSVQNQGQLGGAGGATSAAIGNFGNGIFNLGLTQPGSGGGGGGGASAFGGASNGGRGGNPGPIAGSQFLVLPAYGAGGIASGAPGQPGTTDIPFSWTVGGRVGVDLDALMPSPGGGGGGAGHAVSGGVSLGGNGGRGGGLLLLEARTSAILSSPGGGTPCILRSSGEAGGAGLNAGGNQNGAGGGGGGGAGGLIIACYGNKVPLTFDPAFDVAGGAGGAGGIPLAGVPGFNPPRFGGAGAPGRPGYASWKGMP